MFDKSIPFLEGGGGRLPWRSGSSIITGKAGQRRSCRIKGPPHADVCTGNCWHHLVGWEPLQRASEINDSLTSTSGASLCLQSRAFRSISRLKGMERCSAKQQKCPYWVPGAQTIVAFFRFLQPTLCPQGLSL